MDIYIYDAFLFKYKFYKFREILIDFRGEHDTRGVIPQKLYRVSHNFWERQTTRTLAATFVFYKHEFHEHDDDDARDCSVCVVCPNRSESRRYLTANPIVVRGQTATQSAK